MWTIFKFFLKKFCNEKETMLYLTKYAWRDVDLSGMYVMDFSVWCKNVFILVNSCTGTFGSKVLIEWKCMIVSGSSLGAMHSNRWQWNFHSITSYLNVLLYEFQVNSY